MRKGRSYQRGSDLSTHLAEILDQHDIALNLVRTLEKNPLPIRRDIKGHGARDHVSQIQRSECFHPPGREVQESERGGRGRPVNEVHAVWSDLPPGKPRHTLQDADGLPARDRHSPNRPPRHPHVEKPAIGRFLRAEPAVFRNLDRRPAHGWHFPNLPSPRSEEHTSEL